MFIKNNYLSLCLKNNIITIKFVHIYRNVSFQFLLYMNVDIDDLTMYNTIYTNTIAKHGGIIHGYFTSERSED